MKQMLTLTSYSQLKALSDPFRAQIMMRLIERPHTGQMLSEKLNMSRAKIHYHLKELEKNGLVELARKEEKGGIIQKFYQSVARGFTPATELLFYEGDVSEAARQMSMQMAEKTKNVILSAPEQAFQKGTDSEDPAEWDYVTSMWQVQASQKDFKNWIKKYFDLMEEMRNISRQAQDDPNSHYYFISMMAFEVDELIMEDIVDKEEGD